MNKNVSLFVAPFFFLVKTQPTMHETENDHLNGGNLCLPNETKFSRLIYFSPTKL